VGDLIHCLNGKKMEGMKGRKKEYEGWRYKGHYFMLNCQRSSPPVWNNSDSCYKYVWTVTGLRLPFLRNILTEPETPSFFSLTIFLSLDFLNSLSVSFGCAENGNDGLSGTSTVMGMEFHDWLRVSEGLCPMQAMGMGHTPGYQGEWIILHGFNGKVPYIMELVGIV
jgi:hypothetical protein